MNHVASIIEDALTRISNLEIPLLRELQVGHDPQQIDQLFKPFPCPIPTALYTYFTWQKTSTTPSTADQPPIGWVFRAGHTFRLIESINLYQMYIKLNQEGTGVDLAGQIELTKEISADPYFITYDGPLWDPRWLPLLGDGAGGTYFVVCSTDTVDTSPIYYRYSHGGEFFLAFDSVPSWLCTLADAFEQDAYFVTRYNNYVGQDRAKLKAIYDQHNPHREAYFMRTSQANSVQGIVLNLGHPDWSVRGHVLVALRNMYDPEIAPLLREQREYLDSKMHKYIDELLQEREEG